MSVEKWGWASVAITSCVALALGAFLFVYANGLDSGQNQAVAAWVQAIGSVAAIIGAIWIANNQHRATMEFAERQAKAQTRDFVESCLATVIHAQSLLLKVPGPATTNDDALNVFFAIDFRTYQVLDSAANALMVIPPYKLPTQEAISALIKFNASISETRGVISDMAHFHSNPMQGDWRVSAARLEPILWDASEARRALEQFLGRDDELIRLGMPGP